MAQSGLRTLALGALTPDRLLEVVREGETLFVEHKQGISGGSGHQIAKAAASLANTMGGWILIGVHNGQIVDWEPPREELVDAVRQRLEAHIDPMPSFAAGIVETPDGRVGVVRVYESADTPHLVGGTIYVREPAKDANAKAQPPYQPSAVRSHYEVAQLVERGSRAREAAWGRLPSERRERSVLDRHLAAADGHGRGSGPLVTVLLTPMTLTARWRAWPTSRACAEALPKLVTDIIGEPDQNAEPRPIAEGVTTLCASREWPELTPGGHRRVRKVALAATHNGGLIGAAIRIGLERGDGCLDDWRSFDEGRSVGSLLEPLLVGVTRTLEDAELLGRYAASVRMEQLSEIYRVRPDRPNEITVPTTFLASGEITVDGRARASGDDPDREALVAQWSRELARASGVAIWD